MRQMCFERMLLFREQKHQEAQTSENMVASCGRQGDFCLIEKLPTTPTTKLQVKSQQVDTDSLLVQLVQ